MTSRYSQWEKWECREEVQSLKNQADSDSEGQGRGPSSYLGHTLGAWLKGWGRESTPQAAGFQSREPKADLAGQAGVLDGASWRRAFRGQGKTERQTAPFIWRELRESWAGQGAGDWENMGVAAGCWASWKWRREGSGWELLFREKMNIMVSVLP